MTPERRDQVRGAIAATRTGWRNGVREVCWTLGLLDDHDNPSGLKLMALAFGLAAVDGPLHDHVATTGYDILMGFLAACSYIGYRGLAIFASTRGAPPVPVTAVVVPSAPQPGVFGA